ncbi:MAG: anion transporter [Opitutaceae bacterium]|nr:anion transporter [Opitutaceae bacterium]
MDWLMTVSGTIIVVTLIGVAVGRYPWLHMNRATIALVGAILLVALGVPTLDQAYHAVDWNTILLLFGMMILNANLRHAGFFHLVTSHVVCFARTPRRLLALVVLVSGMLSAIFLNDTIALMMTPMVIDMTLALGRNPLPYLVALVTSANVGSVATIIGNPQNMLVGVSSGISFVQFFRELAPIAAMGLFVVWGVIVVVYRSEYAPFALPAVAQVTGHEDPLLLRKAMFATGLMLIALIAGAPIPLAAMLAAALLLISRRQRPERVFQEIDWSLLVFFSSLFVVTGAIEASGIGDTLFLYLQPLANEGPARLALSSVVLSNLVSNVPAVMLFRPVVPMLDNPESAWLTLAMTTTLAGNLTLLGSVANLIVAEIARQRGIHLSFAEYMKAGTAIAVVTLVLGVAWLTW